MLFALMASVGFTAPKKVVVPLTPEGEKALAGYTGMLDALRADLKDRIPEIDQAQAEQLMAAHKNKRDTVKQVKDKKGQVIKTELTTMEAARLILPDLESFLGSDALDKQLVTCAVLASATPRGLAEFAQQGTEQKKLIDDLLADPKLMQEMLYAGGAKAGRYGQAMEIYRLILASSARSKAGHFRRLALATGLELAAADLDRNESVEPVKRYRFYEKSYLDKELDSRFDTFSTWLYRHVVNDSHTEADMLWMCEMLWNYRPDQINAPEEYPARYVGLMYSEFGHKRPEFDETLPTTRFQQTIDKGYNADQRPSSGVVSDAASGFPYGGPA